LGANYSINQDSYMIDLYHEEFKNVLLVCHPNNHQPQNFWD